MGCRCYGPKKALRTMEQTDPEAFSLYSKALNSMNRDALSAWIACLQPGIWTTIASLDKRTHGFPGSRVYLKTPNAPGQRAFSRRAASFFLEIRQYSCEKMSCAVRKFLAAGHIESWKNTP